MCSRWKGLACSKEWKHHSSPLSPHFPKLKLATREAGGLWFARDVWNHGFSSSTVKASQRAYLRSRCDVFCSRMHACRARTGCAPGVTFLCCSGCFQSTLSDYCLLPLSPTPCSPVSPRVGWGALREGSGRREKQRNQEERGSGSQRSLSVPIWVIDVALFTWVQPFFPARNGQIRCVQWASAALFIQGPFCRSGD